MVSNEVIIAVIGVISTIISGWVSWFFSRKKYDSEVDSVLIENMKHSLEFYKSLADDNKERLLELQENNDDLRREVNELRTQVFKLMAQIYDASGDSTILSTTVKKRVKNEHRSNKKTF
jgi:hypothetical protein|nr:MAG TPA: holin [Crassvirales sp.]